MELQDLIGKTFGSCRLVNPIHTGGLGYSFISFDDQLLKYRITKVSRMPFGEDKELRFGASIFKKEGRILSKLDHPQIGKLIEQGEENGYLFLTKEYVEGMDLDKVLWILVQKQKEMQCPWNELLDPLAALAVVYSALVPLDYIHNAKIQLPGGETVEGLAHRDLCPSNLVLSFGNGEKPMMYIIDFGIAKINIDYSATLDTAVLGHARYMSPMRFLRKRRKGKQGEYWKTFQHTQHDIHALGCILFELLTGEPHIKVSSHDISAAVQAVLNPKTYATLYHRMECFDEELQHIIRKSVVYPDIKRNRGPHQYKNASEMLNDIQAVFQKHSGQKSVDSILYSFSREMEFAGILKKNDKRNTTLIKEVKDKENWLKVILHRSGLLGEPVSSAK
jgi:serine/threonine protein kinase